MTAPWQWVICDTSPDAIVHAAGMQHTSLYAPADTIAEERLTVHAYNLLLAGRGVDVQQLVCRVRRSGATDWSGFASGDRLCLPVSARSR